MKPVFKPLVFVLLIALVALAACGPAEPEPTATLEPTATEPIPTDTATPIPPTEVPPTATPIPSPTATVEPTPEESDEVVLTLIGNDEMIELTMADLKAMPAVEGWGGIKNSTGRITLPAVYKGVALKDLVDLLGEIDEASGVSVVAEDGYAMTLAYNQIYGGNFIAYDPATGEETDPGGELVSVVAYELEGNPLPEDSEGTLRLVVLGESNLQVTDGHWWVKWTNAVEVLDQGAEWFLNLDGVITEEMDRATFESCASPSCHGVTWTAEDGSEWRGTPLYLVAARVDDENKHDFGGFNVELAQAGYTITLTAADGYEVEIASGVAQRSEDYIVAIAKDEEPLPEDYYPLRLVGPDLAKSEMVGQIASVKVILGPTAMAMVSAPAGEAVLSVTGLVERELSLSPEAFEAMGVVQATVEHPKDGPQDYEGVPLNAVLSTAGPKWAADLLRLVASDGYSVDIELATLKSCTDCLIAYGKDGALMSVMPGQSNQAWVKDLQTIELLQAGAEVPGEEETTEGDAAVAETTEETTEDAGAADVDQSSPEDAALSVTGLVSTELYLSMETLQSLDVSLISAEHPKDGTVSEYEGILLADLLQLAVPTADASTLVFVASDGYQGTLTLSEALDCAECLVAFADDGTLKMVMPELPSSVWVKDVVSIDVQ